MKLECKVTRASNSGESMTVVLKGRQKRDADWRRDGEVQIEFACSDAAKRAFYLGRSVTVTVEPR